MKNFKLNRAVSFIIVTLVYAIAGVSSIFIYKAFNLPFWLTLLIADALATVIVFIYSVTLNNASVYDPYWSVQPIFILICYAVQYGLTLSGWIILVVVCLWGIRLTANWAYTFKNLTHQDWRYTMLKEQTGLFYPIINFIGIHMVPTVVVYACTLPAVYVIVEGASFSWWTVAFSCLSVFAFTMQGIADIQMHKFRRSGVKGFNRTGLWKYSRHPNYLGEILMWWGVGLASVFALNGHWYLLGGALLNTLLFACVSIPMAEKRQGRKEGFSEYKSQTRYLLPLKRFR